ncbi:MAG: glutamate synthase subunit beta [Candidatus Omnitrophota bacterium]
MGDTKGFLKFKRQLLECRPVCERLKDFREVGIKPTPSHYKDQASRCMDCGTPFCHWGCPIANYIPEWNDLLSRKQLRQAYENLSATNNLPEITGRVCPAPCEFACVLGINDDPVTVRENELAIIEEAFRHGLVQANPPRKRTKKSVAVVGSGPAGLSCADQLNKAGHNVVVFEQDALLGGMLRFGIPDFKLEKWILDRRVNILKKEGIEFLTKVNVDLEKGIAKLKKEFDCLALACGARTPRDLNIEGRDLNGIHFALDYLVQSNKRVAGEVIPAQEIIDAKGKKVVVIGGGDTGADCVGVALRQGATCVAQIELLPQPSSCRSQEYPWPRYPLILKTSSSHQEGGERKWSILTKKFIGDKGAVKRLSCVQAAFEKDASGCPAIKEATGTEFEIEAGLVILAMGFLKPKTEGVFKESRGIFLAGDMRRGPSLIVWAIYEGRAVADSICRYLI